MLATGSASADTGIKGCYTVEVDGYVDTSESLIGISRINEYRQANGQEPIKGDNTYEKEAVTRAAEFSMYYSKNRPSGLPGTSALVGIQTKNETFTAWFNRIDSDQKKILLDARWKTGWVGVFRTRSNTRYIAIHLSESEPKGANTPALYTSSNKKYPITFPMKEKCISWGTTFVDNVAGKELADDTLILKAGQEYYQLITYWNEAGDLRYFDSQYMTSSNPSVIYETEQGVLHTKNPGTSILTIKPAKEAKESASRTIVIRPNKVTGVKLTAKKKAMKISWKKTTGAAGYKVYRSTSKNGKYKLVKVASSKTASYTNKKLKKKKKYYYKVRAYVQSGDRRWYGSYSNTYGKKTK